MNWFVWLRNLDGMQAFEPKHGEHAVTKAKSPQLATRTRARPEVTKIACMISSFHVALLVHHTCSLQQDNMPANVLSTAAAQADMAVLCLAHMPQTCANDC